MRIGIDYDGVIADTNFVKSAWVKKNLGMRVPKWKMDRSHCLPLIGLKEYHQMSRIVYGKAASEGTPAVPGTAKALSTLRKKGAIYIITMRKNQNVRYVKEWLKKKNLLHQISQIIHLGSNHVSKEQICEKLGITVLIDDDVRHLREIKQKGIEKVLLKHNGPKSFLVPKGILYARSWEEVLRLI